MCDRCGESLPVEDTVEVRTGGGIQWWCWDCCVEPHEI